METMRSTWTDERLDDLTRRMDGGFERVARDIRELRSEMNARFERVDARFERVDARFDSMQRTMFGMLATIVAGFLVTNL
jgi:hypothetical protein